MLYYELKLRLIRRRAHEMADDCSSKVIQATLESQESERKRFAADLHDDIGAALAAARLGLDSIARKKPDIRGRLNDAILLIDGTIESIRRISHGLMPAVLERFGLRQAVLELCQQFARASEISIEFAEEGQCYPIDTQKGILIYRIVQELIQNAIKHAGGAPIVIRLNWGNQLMLEVSDQGSGFDATLRRNAHGIGMVNIENRARLLGGKLRYDHHRPTGTKVRLSIPVQ